MINTELGNAIREIEAKKSNGNIYALKSGFSDFDRITGGFQNGSLYTLAGVASLGKSALAQSIMRNLAIVSKVPVAYFSLEQTSTTLINRLLSAESQIDYYKIKRGALADYEWAQLNHKVAKLSDAPIYITDCARLRIDEFVNQSRYLVENNGVQFIILDDLHRVSLCEEQRKYAANREQEISIIVRELKSIAKELNVPVLVIAQLSRSVSSRGGDKKPMLSDLRDSGAVEYESDVIVFLYRAEYYGITEDEMGNSTIGIADLIVAKNREGEVGVSQVQFVGKFCSFSDIEALEESPNFIFNTVRLGSKMLNDLPYSTFDDAPPF